jgi:hypothetical protein
MMWVDLFHRCEKRSDEAILCSARLLDCFASLEMTS